MSGMAEKLRKHLQSISQEEFEKEWAEIEKLGLQGPTVEAFNLSLELQKIIEVNKALAEKSALLRLNSNSYFNSRITYNGNWYLVEDYIKEILNPIIDNYDI